jgi:hypothetical protein
MNFRKVLSLTWLPFRRAASSSPAESYFELNAKLNQQSDKLNQLMSQNIAQSAVIKVLCCELAASFSDWREKIGLMRMTTEWSIKNLEWGGSGEDEERNSICSEALSYLQSEFDEVHAAVLRQKQNAPRPD